MDVFCHGGQSESELNRRQCEKENGKETAAGSLDEVTLANRKGFGSLGRLLDEMP